MKLGEREFQIFWCLQLSIRVNPDQVFTWKVNCVSKHYYKAVFGHYSSLKPSLLATGIIPTTLNTCYIEA